MSHLRGGKPLTSYSEKAFLRTPKEAKPLKAVNKERVAKKKETEGFDPDYLKWIRKQACIVTHATTGGYVLTFVGISALGSRQFALPWRGPVRIESAHMRAGRTKGTDASALPVESVLHKEQHDIGIQSWAKKYNLDLPALIAAHRKAYALEMAGKVKAAAVSRS